MWCLKVWGVRVGGPRSFRAEEEEAGEFVCERGSESRVVSRLPNSQSPDRTTRKARCSEARLSLRAASHRLGGSVGDGVHRRPGVEQPERKVDGGMTDRCESSILISVALVGIVGGSSLGRPVHI